MAKVAKGSGKGGKGKGRGKGKWGKGFQYYRSPGNAVGKGLNKLDDGWYNAWGGDSVGDYDYDHCGGDWQGWDGYGGNLRNVSMLLERGEEREDEHSDDTLKQTGTSTGEWGPLKNTKRATPTIVHNRYDVLLAECDTEDEENISNESDSETCEQDNNTVIAMTCLRNDDSTNDNEDVDEKCRMQRQRTTSHTTKQPYSSQSRGRCMTLQSKAEILTSVKQQRGAQDQNIAAVRLQWWRRMHNRNNLQMRRSVARLRVKIFMEWLGKQFTTTITITNHNTTPQLSLPQLSPHTTTINIAACSVAQAIPRGC